MRRFAATRRRQLRRSLRAGSLLVAAISVVAAISFLATDSAFGQLLGALALVQAAGSLAVAHAARRGHHAEALAFAFMTGVLIVPLASLDVRPERLLLIGGSLTLIPSAVALFLALRERIYLGWVGAFGGILALNTLWLARQGDVTSLEAYELLAVCGIGVTFGVLGARLRGRAERELFRRDQQRRSLVARARQQQADLASLNRELTHLARTDPLTGASNRLRLDEDLVALGDRLLRYQRGFSLVLFDLDHFKLFNDRYGHLAGDRALSTVVELIVNTVRTTDTVYRFGGEEFVVLMPEPRGSRALAERVRQVVSRAGMEHADNDAWGVVTISAGIVTVRAGDAGDSDSWLVRADRALYAAKLGGRNRIAVARKLGPPVAVGAPPRQVSPA